MRRSLTALAAVLLLAACSSTSEPDPTSSASATEVAETAAALTVGGSTVLSVAADQTSYDIDVTGIRTERVDGTSHVLAEVTITVSTGELAFVSGWNPGLAPVLAAGGEEYEQTPHAVPGMFDGTIGESESQNGVFGFEAPASASETGVFQLEVLSLSGTTVHEWTY
jgi:hypothetical protein